MIARRKKKKIVLVTGCPRSGTTWVGRVLAASPNTSYVLEPFNLNRAPYFGIPLDCWYPQFGDKVDPVLLQAVERTVSGNIVESQVQVNGVPPLTTRIRGKADRLCSTFAKFVLVKDPNAILSADWLHTQFDAKVVITMRHPAAVVSSIRNQGWPVDYRQLAERPEVVEKFFPDVQDWINANPRGAEQSPYLYSAAIFWRLMHLVVCKYMESFPNWTFVKYEDLASDPTGQFIELFKAVDMPFTKSNKALLGRTITNDKPTSHAKNSVPTSNINRDTERMKWIWKDRLKQNELALIRSLTEDVASPFYTAQDWQ